MRALGRFDQRERVTERLRERVVDAVESTAVDAGEFETP